MDVIRAGNPSQGRRRMRRGKSRRLFSRTAKRIQSINYSGVMRGGTRL